MNAGNSSFPDGVLLVYKPAGYTSFDVVRKVKPWVHPQKVGHTGTLDPMATGLLALAIGEATKLFRLLSNEEKRYHATIRLGVATDTLDFCGKEVSSAVVPPFDTKKILDCMALFTGEILQTPPMYSALHHQGRRMYQLAREGVEVRRRPRKVLVKRLALLGHGPDWLEMDVTCGPGTYIRSLAADLAERLGTIGHLTALERIESCGWTVKQARELQQLSQRTLRAAIIPLEEVLSRFPKVDIPQETARRLEQGQMLAPDEISAFGLHDRDKTKTIWLRPLKGSPIVVVDIKTDPNNIPKMKVFCLLRPVG